ncbi:PASTA domain-containing protein [Deinococcus navajonensis]|uniref:PASTA domain-containing protein n=1 Tax=Deinococcus navajonensis TaxID=309884 RepID=A0ABV8XPV8_9DEIO
MTGQAGTQQLIDGKYEIVRELSRDGHVTLSEVRAGEGVTRQVAWFDVTTPADRQAFHAYRTAVRTLAPAGLTDVVARPGAYYAVWQPVTGVPLETVMVQPSKPEETVDAVRALAARLAVHGFALADADIVVEGHEPRIAYLRPAHRTPEDAALMNTATLAALSGGRVRPRRQPGAWLSFVPGLLFLGGAVYLGVQAAQIYLNPPVQEVASVTGKAAREATQQLVKAGYRVQYTEGQAGGLPIGAIIRQDPAGGTSLPVGRLITLTVNNPPAVQVPRLEEMTLTQAKAALKDGALALGKVLKVDGTLTNTAEGHVIAQIPQPGAQTQPGQPVQVMVSTGVQGKDTWIPNLAGMTYEQARDHVRAAGLVVTRVRERPSDEPANSVLEQTPAPYVRVAVGSPVTLTVATARYSPPTQSAGSLPLPPAYVPPALPDPEAPEEPTAPDGSGTPGTTTPGDGATQTPPTTTSPTTTTPTAPPAAVPDTSAGDVNLPSSNVNFNYTFPADLPDGSYTVVVRDADGERAVLAPTDAAQLRGATASSDNAVTVRGDAVFIIRRDGAEFATVTP